MPKKRCVMSRFSGALFSRNMMSAVCLLGGWEEEEEEDGGRNENRLISHARCTPRQKKRGGGGSFASLSKKNMKRKGTTKGLSSLCLTVYRNKLSLL